MNNKIRNFVMKNVFIAFAVVIVIMLFVPFSFSVLEFLLGVEIAAAIGILIYSFVRRYKSMPELNVGFAMFSLAVNVGLLRSVLTGYESGLKINTAGKLSVFLSEGGYIISFIAALILLTVQLVFISKICKRISRKTAAYSLDNMQKMYLFIDEKQNQGKISDEEAEKFRSKIAEKTDFYSNLDGSAKLLLGNAKVSVILTFLNIIGGILISLLMAGFSFSEAVPVVMTVTSLEAAAFVLPQLIVNAALAVCFKNIPEDKVEK